jgi:hypothetical protein
MDMRPQPPARSVSPLRRIWQSGLVSILIVQLAAPLPAMSAVASLGTARGVRGVELSLDSGKTWLSLGTNALPVVDDTYIRSSTGNALLDLADGSRINLLPFTAVSLKETGSAIELTLHYGRLTFALPSKTQVVILSKIARLDPVRSEVMAGEVVVDGKGTLGLKMSRGRLQVTDLTDRRQVRLASVEPVFLPKRPPAEVSFLSSPGSASPPPADAKPIFNPQGQSLGYLRPDGQLVVQPGFTSNLSRAFPPKVIQTAMAKVAPEDRQTAMPFFDLGGGYVGYVSGPVFYAQVQPARVQPVQVAQAVVGAPGSPREARREGCWVPSPPPGARDVFDPSGRNIGYLTPNPVLVLHEGPAGAAVPADVVQGVVGQFPTNSTPLFDSNGTYLGYLSGSDFYPAGSLEGSAVKRPIHCGYFVLGALSFAGLGVAIYFAVRNIDIGFHEKEATTNLPGQP